MVYILYDQIEAYASARCPAAFAIVNDLNTYTFMRKFFFGKDGSYFRGDSLRVGSVGNCQYVYADIHPNNREVVFYLGKPGHDVEPTGLMSVPTRDIFPDLAQVATSNTKIKYPFSLALEDPLQGVSDMSDTNSLQETRFRLGLLVQFAYFLKGDLDSIEFSTPYRHGSLEDFVTMCEFMQRQQELSAQRTAKKNTSLDNEAALDNMQGLLREEHQPRRKSALSLSEQGRKRKTLGVTDEDDDESYTLPITRRTEILILLQPYC
jgi:hypothetical protein